MFIDLAESQSFTKQKVDKTKQFGDESPGINHHSSDVAVIIIHPNKCNVPADVHTHTHKNAENPWFSIWKITYKWSVAHIFLHAYRVSYSSIYVRMVVCCFF